MSVSWIVWFSAINRPFSLVNTLTLIMCWENPHVMVQVERDHPKLNVFVPYLGGIIWILYSYSSSISWKKIKPYNLNCQQNGLAAGLAIGHEAPDDRLCFARPQCSPDLMACDFYLWKILKNVEHELPLPAEVRNGIEATGAYIEHL